MLRYNEIIPGIQCAVDGTLVDSRGGYHAGPLVHVVDTRYFQADMEYCIPFTLRRFQILIPTRCWVFPDRVPWNL
jgi:hypothetical protein